MSKSNKNQNSLLLIILSIVLVGLVISLVISLLTDPNIQPNKEAIIQDLNILAKNAYQFYSRPAAQGGGGGTYTANEGYIIPLGLISNNNGSYACIVTEQTVTFLATSKLGYGTITAECGSTGNIIYLTYTGQFRSAEDSTF